MEEEERWRKQSLDKCTHFDPDAVAFNHSHCSFCESFSALQNYNSLQLLPLTMFSNEYKQQFIPQSPHDDESVESFEEHHYTPTKKSIRHRNTWIVLGGFILSLSLNVFQYLRPHQPATPQQATQYSKIQFVTATRSIKLTLSTRRPPL